MPDLRDLVLVAGLVSTGVGLWIHDPGAALVVVGSILLYLALWHGRITRPPGGRQ